MMEIKNSWRARLTFRNATICVSIFNILTAFFLLHAFISSSRKLPRNNLISAQIKYIRESNTIRRAMEPLQLIKRVREIEQESYGEPETVQQKDTKQTAASDLSKRLKDFRSSSDAASLKALEEWRKRKMDRARLRELEKNVTHTSQA